MMNDGNSWARVVALKIRLKDRLGPLWWYSAVMFSVQRLGDLINIYIGLLLVPRFVPQDELGALIPLTQVGALLGLPLAIILIPFMKFTNVFAARGEMGKVKALLQDMLLLVAVTSVGVAIYTYLVSSFVFERMRVNGGMLVWVLCSLVVFGAVTPVLSNALQSLQRYRIMAVSGMVLPSVRLGLLWLLLPACGVLGYFSGQLLVAVLVAVIAVWGLRQVLSSGLQRQSYRCHLPEMARFTAPLLILNVAGTIQGTCEPFVIRHFLPDQDNAAFYYLSMFASIPSGLWGALSIAFFPLVSERHERGEKSGKMLGQVLMIILLIGGVISLVLTLSTDWLLGLSPTWAVARPFGWLMGPLLLRMLFLQAVACFVTHEIACRRFRFVWYAASLPLIESVLLYGLEGLSFSQPYLPASWWQVLSSLAMKRLDFVVFVMLGYATLGLACVAGQLLLRMHGAGTKTRPA